jgi:hypothetical protein
MRILEWWNAQLHHQSLRRLLMLTSIVLVPTLIAAAEIDTELLRQVTRAHRANRSRIKQWTGTVQIRDVTSKKTYPVRSITSEVEFTYDSELDALRWNKTVKEAVESIGDVKTPVRDRYVSAGLRIDGALTSVRISEEVDGTQEVTVTISEAAQERFLPLDENFDPMSFVNFEDLPSLFEHIAKALDAAQPEDSVVRREGDIVTFETGGKPPANVYVANLAQGGNLIEFRAETGSLKTLDTIRLAEQEEIWLPCDFKHTRTSKDGTKTREIHWTISVVNGGADKEAFTMERLGIAKGQEIYDKRNRTRYKFGSDEPPVR